MTPLKELAFLAHGGTMTEQERQKKEAGQRSEDATGEVEGKGIYADCMRRSRKSVLKEVMDPLKSIFLNMKENKMLFGSHQSVCSSLFRSSFRHRRVGAEGLKACQFGTVSTMCYLLGGKQIIGVRSSQCARVGCEQFHVQLASRPLTCIYASIALNPFGWSSPRNADVYQCSREQGR